MSRLPTTSIRIVLFALGLIGLLIGPWVLTLIAVVLLSLRFRAWEALLLGLMTDLLWAPSGGFLHSFPFFTIGAIIIVWGLEPLRRQLLSSA